MLTELEIQAFNPNDEGNTYKDFKKIAEKFQNKYFSKYKDLNHDERTEELEKEYWKIVEDNIGERVEVEYAADLSSQEYGSCFPQHCDNEYSNHPWNLKKMDQDKNSLLQV